MKCPTCGDTEQQERLGPTEGQKETRYRCAGCGRLYPVRDLAGIIACLDAMKVQAEELGQRREEMLAHIAATEAQIRGDREHLPSTHRRLRNR